MKQPDILTREPESEDERHKLKERVQKLIQDIEALGPIDGSSTAIRLLRDKYQSLDLDKLG